MVGRDGGNKAYPWDDLMFRLRTIDTVTGGADVRKPLLLITHALIVLTCGRVKLALNEQHIDLAHEEVLLVAPEQTLGMELLTDETELYILYFDIYRHQDREHIMTMVTDWHPLQPGQPLTLHVKEWLTARCKELRLKWQTASSLDRFRSHIEFQELIYTLVRYGQPAKTSAASVERARQYIDEHFADPLEIEQLAKVAGLSPKYFVERFKKQTGMSVTEYITMRRLQEAKRLMAHTGAKMRDIANLVGYEDEFYFSRIFKKKIGVPPTVYINSRRRKLVACDAASTGHLLALGRIPFAAPIHPKWTETYYRDYRNEIPVHLSAYRCNQDWRRNLEQILRLPADLIIAPDRLPQEDRRMLEQTAPVFYCPHSTKPWRESLFDLAEALGETWQAKNWVEQYQRRVMEARKSLPTSLRKRTFAGLRMVNGQLFLYSNRGMAEVIYQDLGFSCPASFHGETCYHIPVMPEELADLDADHLLLLIRRDSLTLHEWAKMERSPAWQKVRAVFENRLHFLSSDPWCEYSAHAIWRMLDQAVRVIAGDLSMNVPVFVHGTALSSPIE